MQGPNSQWTLIKLLKGCLAPIIDFVKAYKGGVLSMPLLGLCAKLVIVELLFLSSPVSLSVGT